MAFDFWKPLRRCFLCKGRKHLSRVVNGGYNTEFHYYHEECYQKVVRNPEQYQHAVDVAIHITDELEKTRRDELASQQQLTERIERLRGNVRINSTPTQLVNVINVTRTTSSENGNEVDYTYVPSSVIESIRNQRGAAPQLNETLDKKLKEAQNVSNKDKSNKFKKIFK